jgi:co-chaperonin GroES (HSP10)
MTDYSVSYLLGDDYTPELRAAFPDVQPPFKPFGYLALLQLRQPKEKSRGGIILPDSEKDVERFRTQATLVRALGPACFKDRKTFEEWPEGPWYQPGDFVRCPMYGGDRFNIAADDRTIVTFVFVKEADVLALVTGNPLDIEHS